MLGNYHTHCTYCDGKDELGTFVEEAQKKNFDYLGFSSHAPMPGENNFAISEEDIPHYLNDIDRLRSRFPGIRLFSGLECDYVPGVTRPFSDYKNRYRLDFIIGGIHLVRPAGSDELWFIDGSKREIYDAGLTRLFSGDIRKAVTRFWEQTFEMLETQSFDIIAHLDKIKMHNQGRFFTQNEDWYIQLADHALDLIKRKNCIIEINTRGVYKGRCDTFYPSDSLLRKAASSDIPFVISSDAHKAEELGLYHPEAMEALKQAGVRRLCYLDTGGWKEYGL